MSMVQDDIFVTLTGYVLYMFTVILSYKFSWKTCNWYAIISFTLLLGLRGNGIDYHGHSYQFDYLYSLDYSLFDERFYNADYNYHKQNFEFGYLIILKICKILKLSNIAFFMTIAFVQMFFLDMFIRKFRSCKIKQLLVFFFFTTLMFVESFNVMRQLIAILMYINIIPFLEHRDLKRYFIYTGLLYMVHASTVILLPLYFFIHKDFVNKKSTQIIIYLCAIVMSNFVIDYILNLFDIIFNLFDEKGTKLIGYLNTEKEVVKSSSIVSVKITTYIFRFVGIAFLIANSIDFKKKYGIYGIILYNLTFIGFVIQEFIFGIGIQRLNYYFYYISFIVLSLMCYMNIIEKQHGIKGIVYSYTLMVVYFMWFVNSISQGAAECAPYVFSKLL